MDGGRNVSATFIRGAGRAGGGGGVWWCRDPGRGAACGERVAGRPDRRGSPPRWAECAGRVPATVQCSGWWGGGGGALIPSTRCHPPAVPLSVGEGTRLEAGEHVGIVSGKAPLPPHLHASARGGICPIHIRPGRGSSHEWGGGWEGGAGGGRAPSSVSRGHHESPHPRPPAAPLPPPPPAAASCSPPTTLWQWLTPRRGRAEAQSGATLPPPLSSPAPRLFSHRRPSWGPFRPLPRIRRHPASRLLPARPPRLSPSPRPPRIPSFGTRLDPTPAHPLFVPANLPLRPAPPPPTPPAAAATPPRSNVAVGAAGRAVDRGD